MFLYWNVYRMFCYRDDKECSVIGTNTGTSAKYAGVRTNAWDSAMGNNT